MFHNLQEKYIERKSLEALVSEGDYKDDGGYHKLNDEMAWKQGEKLEVAKRAVMEVEHGSLGVMRDLENQTQQLKIITGKVGDMNIELEESNSIMARIMKRENRNKLIIGIVSIVVIVIMIIILYFSLAPSSTSVTTLTPSPGPSFSSSSPNNTTLDVNTPKPIDNGEVKVNGESMGMGMP